MTVKATSATVETSDVAVVLGAMADLMERFHESDMALQSALSVLASRARATPDMVDLQHVDLLTQTHCDLARLLPELAACLKGRPTEMAHLKSKLTLRSLQDALLEGEQDREDRPEPGELSLF